MHNSTVFLDANILADLYLGRPRYAKVTKLLRELNGQISVSVLSVEICSYISRKEKSLGLATLNDFINTFTTLPVTGSTLNGAFSIAKDSDLEDALQVYCAIEANSSVFITADENLYKRYHDMLDIRLITG
jgi:predicted nucleic acid-binding protein